MEEEQDELLQLKIENSVLECEKKKAESDVEYWKSKYNELELEVLELKKKLASKAGDSISTKTHWELQDESNNLAQSMAQKSVYNMEKVDEIQNKAGLDANSNLCDGEIGSLQSQDSGKSLTKTPSIQGNHAGENKTLLCESGKDRVNQVRKQLIFEEKKGSKKRMAPSTPAGERPAKVAVIDIDESEDERTTGPLCTSIDGSDYKTSVHLCTPPVPECIMARGLPYRGSGSTLSDNELPSEKILKTTYVEQGEHDDVVFHNKKVLDVLTPKRKRPSNVIASDSDTDADDDNVPISTLKSKDFNGRSSDDLPNDQSIQTGDSKDDVRKLSSRRRLVKLSQCEGKGGGGNDTEEDVSESEGESLDGFIVCGSDISDDDISNSDGSLQSIASATEDSECRMARSLPYRGSGSTLSDNELPSEKKLKTINVEQGERDDVVFHNKKVLDVPTLKRKGPSNVIATDSDTDADDDKVPISTLMSKHFHGRSSNDLPNDHSIQTGDSKDDVRKLSSRRRLVKLSQCEGKGGGGNDIEEDVSESEGESLDGFIVSGSDISDDDISNSDGPLQSIASATEDSATNSENISESDTDYGEIMSRIQRKKNDIVVWEFEGDMLAAFGKDPELCMLAVCVLYRQQTSEEQSSKETIFYNQRGFSHVDALRGSILAEFLTDGDPQGDVKKAVKELQAHDPKGIELCMHLAKKYSKQLFTIYKNKEDPYFKAP